MKKKKITARMVWYDMIMVEFEQTILAPIGVAEVLQTAPNRKSLGSQFFLQFFATTMTWQTMIVEEKIMGQCVSND